MRSSPLARLVIGRLLLAAAMLVLVSIAVFFFTQALPGDVARQILGQNATPVVVRALRQNLGLNRPVVGQYWRWFSHFLRGDFGTSLANRGVSVGSLVSARLDNSLALIVLTVVIAFPLATFLGVTAARHRGGRIDSVISSSIVALLAVPQFLIGVLVITVLASGVFNLVPPVSALDPGHSAWAQPRLLVLPVLSLVLGVLPYLTQMVRATVSEVLEGDFVTWARLNGIPERRVVARHALRSAAPPSVEVGAIILIYLTGGIVAVEAVFSYPGLGLALVNAVQTRDIPVIQAIAMLLAFIALAIYIVADVVVIMLTPKLRTQL